MSGRGRGRGAGGGRGGHFGGILGGVDDDSDPAVQHFKQMAAESKRAFRAAMVAATSNTAARVPQVQMSSDTSAAAGAVEVHQPADPWGRAAEATAPAAPQPAQQQPSGAARAAFFKRFMPGLAAPPALPRSALPPSDFVDHTLDNFDFTRELITAARGAVAAQQLQQQSVRGVRAVPARPRGLPQARGEGKPTTLGPWYQFVATAACPASPGHVRLGPSLGTFAYSDFVSSTQFLMVACRNALRSDSRATALLDDDEHSNNSSSSDGDHASPACNGGAVEDDVEEADAANAPAAKRVRAETTAGPPPTAAGGDVGCEVDLPAAPAVTFELVAGVPSADSAAARFALFLHHGGGGAWLWAALAAVHVPVDPDTERLLHQLFQATVRHLATLHRSDACAAAFGDVLLRNGPQAATPPIAVTDASPPPSWRCEPQSVDGAVLRTCYTVLVVLGKVFKQANPSVMPL